MKYRFLMSIFLLITWSAYAAEPQKLRIGVTLHSYFSWLVNVVAEYAQVIPVIPSGADPHNYQPRPEDIKLLAELDVLVNNGLGHDAFIQSMLKAIDTTQIALINPNQGVPLIPLDHQNDYSAQTAGWNSHSFISITSAIHQIQNIARKLAELDPVNGTLYKQNAQSYIRQLRQLHGKALAQLQQIDAPTPRLATVHHGYHYLFQDLGLTIDTVLQPRHGIAPSPKQLADTIRRLKASQVQILFTDLDYGKQFVTQLASHSAVKVFQLTHISSGDYGKDKFIAAIGHNLQQIVKAVQTNGYQ